MRILVVGKFREAPWGGANQFLRGLSVSFKEKGFLTTSTRAADVILFNSHHDIRRVLWAKTLNPDAVFAHRVDGPISLYNKTGDNRDKWCTEVNTKLANLTIFQSQWSRDQNRVHGLIQSNVSVVIHNAADPTYFFKSARPNLPVFSGSRIKIIAVSWSSNINKGFEIYKYLDQTLDFSRYSMTFVGSSPIEFENINIIPPLTSRVLGETLRGHDLYITASKCDPCSNSLLEGLQCGLPALALDDGGHPEIIGNGGELFAGKIDVIDKLDRVSKNIDYYRKQIQPNSLAAVADRYIEFFGSALLSRKENRHKTKFLTKKEIIKFLIKAPV